MQQSKHPPPETLVRLPPVWVLQKGAFNAAACVWHVLTGDWLGAASDLAFALRKMGCAVLCHHPMLSSSTWRGMLIQWGVALAWVWLCGNAPTVWLGRHLAMACFTRAVTLLRTPLGRTLARVAMTSAGTLLASFQWRRAFALIKAQPRQVAPALAGHRHEPDWVYVESTGPEKQQDDTVHQPKGWTTPVSWARRAWSRWYGRVPPHQTAPLCT